MTDISTVAGTASLPALAPAAGEIARIKSQINLDDRAQLVEYGAGAQREVGDYADRVLKQTKNRELGDTGAVQAALTYVDVHVW